MALTLDDIDKCIHKVFRNDAENDILYLANSVYFKLKNSNSNSKSEIKNEEMAKKAVLAWAIKETEAKSIEDIHAELKEYAYFSNKGNYLKDWFYVVDCFLPNHILKNYTKN
ncbi:hypothetical protein J4433_01280 [Candidatus Pacearchaeota archaeon]|nr:hypothetical protein [Candidatus Pacearchaeota archaeon]